MRKAMSAVAACVSVGGLLMTAPGLATAAVAAPRAATCNAIDAPKAMNDLPASADCATVAATKGARATQAVQPRTSPVSPTTPISGPLSFDRTNGDILAITKVDGSAGRRDRFRRQLLRRHHPRRRFAQCEELRDRV